MAFLTDRTLASGVTLNDLLHIVITSDQTQNPAGSSFKATVSQFADSFSSFYVNKSGDTMTGNLFTPNLTANTISATTYYNLPQDVYVTGMTFNEGNYDLTLYRNDGVSITDNLYILASEVTITGGTYNPVTGIVTFTNNTGGTFDVSGFTTGYTDIKVTAFTYNDLNTLTIFETDGTTHSATINEMSGLTINGDLSVTGDTVLSATTASTLNISSTPTTDTDIPANYLTRDNLTGEVKVKTIPGPTVYGLFAQTGNSVVVSGTTSETSIIGTGVGTLTVPANGFSVGDSFAVRISGDLGANNGDDLTLRVKSGLIEFGVVGPITMPNVTSSHFSFEITFTIRALGTAGNAKILSSGYFTFTQNAGNSFQGDNFSTLNATTFDTTVSSTLSITAQFNSTNSANFIFTELLVLNKIY